MSLDGKTNSNNNNRGNKKKTTLMKGDMKRMEECTEEKKSRALFLRHTVHRVICRFGNKEMAKLYAKLGPISKSRQTKWVKLRAHTHSAHSTSTQYVYVVDTTAMPGSMNASMHEISCSVGINIYIYFFYSSICLYVTHTTACLVHVLSIYADTISHL